MKTDHGAATVAAPCHLGFRLFDLNLWAERRSYPDCAITNVADCSRCRHRGGTVPSGALLCRVKSEFVALDCSFADVDRGDAAAATPCHLEFFHFTGNPRPEAPHSSTGVGEVTTVHGCATVAPPSHLEFYRKPETQVVDAPFGPAQNYLPLCAEDRGFAIATSAEAERQRLRGVAQGSLCSSRRPASCHWKSPPADDTRSGTRSGNASAAQQSRQ
jgi:hypothetical protein